MEPEKVLEFDSKGQDGKLYRILILQHYQEIEGEIASTILPMRKEMRTADGHSVNRINEKRYFIVGPNVEVEKI